MKTVGDMMGVLISLISSDFICITGERNDNGLLKKESVSIFVNPIITKYLYANNLDNTVSFYEKQEIQIKNEKILYNLLQWERLYYMCTQEQCKANGAFLELQRDSERLS